MIRFLGANDGVERDGSMLAHQQVVAARPRAQVAAPAGSAFPIARSPASRCPGSTRRLRRGMASEVR